MFFGFFYRLDVLFFFYEWVFRPGAVFCFRPPLPPIPLLGGRDLKNNLTKIKKKLSATLLVYGHCEKKRSRATRTRAPDVWDTTPSSHPISLRPIALVIGQAPCKLSIHLRRREKLSFSKDRVRLAGAPAL